jgi:hypothetical protein
LSKDKNAIESLSPKISEERLKCRPGATGVGACRTIVIAVHAEHIPTTCGSKLAAKAFLPKDARGSAIVVAANPRVDADQHRFSFANSGPIEQGPWRIRDDLVCRRGRAALSLERDER